MADPTLLTEDGYEFYLMPAATQKPAALVLFLHGHGSAPEEWLSDLERLREKMPEADIIVPRGPYASAFEAEDGSAFTGYSFMDMNNASYARLLLSHIFNRLPFVARLDAFATAQLEKRGLKRKDMACMGFSLGGVIALQLGLTASTPCAAVVAHSAALPAFTRVRSRPDTFLTMGADDDLFMQKKPKAKGLKTVFNAVAKPLSLQYTDTLARLARKKVPHVSKIVPQTGHDIASETVDEGFEFVAQRLAKKPKL